MQTTTTTATTVSTTSSAIRSARWRPRRRRRATALLPPSFLLCYTAGLLCLMLVRHNRSCGGGGCCSAFVVGPLPPRPPHRQQKQQQQHRNKEYPSRRSFRGRRPARTATAAAAAAASSSSDGARAASVAGVSVSPTGFWVVLRLKNSAGTTDSGDGDSDSDNWYWPVRVTDCHEDRTAAQSAEALTLLQLLARVDLAGTVLPPETLAAATALACEETAAEATTTSSTEPPPTTACAAAAAHREIIARGVERAVRDAWDAAQPAGSNPQQQRPQSYRYTDQTRWIRSRVRLPRVSLDEVVVGLLRGSNNNAEQGDDGDEDGGDGGDDDETKPANCFRECFELRCTVHHHDNHHNSEPTTGTAVTVALTDAVLREICHEYRPGGVSRAFVALALGLRYRAPITVVVANGDDDDDDDENDDDGSRSSRTDSSSSSSSSSFPLLSPAALRERLPAFRAASEVRQPADRSAAALVRGFEVHRLQAAWQTARDRGDAAAAARIRRALDELDREGLDELPVQADTDLGSMQ